MQPANQPKPRRKETAKPPSNAKDAKKKRDVNLVLRTLFSDEI